MEACLHYHLVSKSIKYNSASLLISVLSRNSVMFNKTLQDCSLNAFLLLKSGGEVILKNLQKQYRVKQRAEKGKTKMCVALCVCLCGCVFVARRVPSFSKAS